MNWWIVFGILYTLGAVFFVWFFHLIRKRDKEREEIERKYGAHWPIERKNWNQSSN